VCLVVRGGGAAPGAPLDYTVSVNGHVETTRTALRVEHTTLEARDDARQEVIVRPQDAVRGPLAAGVLVAGAGTAVVADVETEISELGVVRFDVPGPLLRGARELVVVIAPAGAHPCTFAGSRTLACDAQKVADASRSRDAAVIRIPVESGASH
jgi:hypothetical protein